MKTLPEQLKSALSEMKLTDKERASMRATLVALLPSAVVLSSNKRTGNKWRRTLPVTILIGLLLSGGVSYAAEGSLPGDPLYGVKIHINEQVRGALAVSEVAKAKLEADLAEERLKEAEQLKSENRLDAATSAQLKAQFSVHRSRANEHIDLIQEVDEKDAVSISTELRARISVHRSGLGLLGIKENEEEASRQRAEGETAVTGEEHSSGIEASTTDSSGETVDGRGGYNDGTKNDEEKDPTIKLDVEVSSPVDIKLREPENNVGGKGIPPVTAPILAPAPPPSSLGE